ncbi:inosine-guanosine kinase [Citrobacter amalonaticus]|nr:inosine-guanosine kinase [Citrobacter amalonaticus]
MIADNPQWWQGFLKENVSILAMNEEEAEALTGENDPLLASDKALDWVDLVLCTAGPVGLYMAGFTEEEANAKLNTRCCLGRLPNLTNMSSAARCAIKTVAIRCASIPISRRIWRSGKDHEHQWRR